MADFRVLCRVITHDPARGSILLVRNNGQDWWCAPGGGWDHRQETVLECAKREVFEEAGIEVSIARFLYTQTLYIKAQSSTWLELFWLARPVGTVEIPKSHVDHFGVVDEARWFTQEDLQRVTAYPEIIKGPFFWDNISEISEKSDRYLGHFML